MFESARPLVAMEQLPLAVELLALELLAGQPALPKEFAVALHANGPTLLVLGDEVAVREAAVRIVLRPVAVVVGPDRLVEYFGCVLLRPDGDHPLRVAQPVVLRAERDPVAAAFLEGVELDRALRLERRRVRRGVAAWRLDDADALHRRPGAPQPTAGDAA